LTKAAAVLAEGVPVPVDAARVNERYFTNIFGIGLDARVAAGASRLRSKLSMRGRAVYYLAGLLEIVRDREPIDAEIVTEHDVFRGPVLLVAAVNGRMYGERCPSLPAPSLRDGLIDLYVIQQMRRMRSLNAALKLARRRPIPEIMIQRCRQVRIVADRDVETHVDGNPMERLRDMTVSAVPRGLEILLPSDAVGWRAAPRVPEAASARS
jgi:diacylglycerol kinase family enzyme